MPRSGVLRPRACAILTLSASGSGASAQRGAFLGFCYALGLGLPFVGIGLLMGKGVTTIGALRRHSVALERVGGGLLVTLGLLLVSGLWDQLLLALRPAVSGFTPSL